VPKCDDGVEAGGTDRRIETEEHTHADADAKGQNDRQGSGVRSQEIMIHN